MVRQRGLPLLALLCLVCVALAAEGPAGPLSPFFEKVKDAGLPVAAWLPKDNAARIDVFSSGKVTRFAFDREGKPAPSPSLAVYDVKALASLKSSAEDAARAAVARDYPQGSLVRAVTLRQDESGMLFAAAAYDAAGKFVGTHLVSAQSGIWLGWVDAVGEIDPLESKE